MFLICKILTENKVLFSVFVVIPPIVSALLLLSLAFPYYRSIQEGEMKIEQRIDEVCLT